MRLQVSVPTANLKECPDRELEASAEEYPDKVLKASVVKELDPPGPKP